MRKRWRAIARLTTSLVLLSFVLLTIGLEQIFDVLRQAKPLPLLLALLIFIVGVLLRALRWRVLLRALEIHAPLGRLVYLYFLGAFFNAFLPTGFGGDVVRAVALAQDTPGAAALGTVVVDRMSGLLALFAMALLALPFSGELLPAQVRLMIGLVSLGGLVAGGLVLQGRWLQRLGKRLPGVLSLSGQGTLARAFAAVSACGWRAVAQALVISFIFNSLLIFVNYLAAFAVGIRLSPTYFVLFVPILAITLMLPISIGGLGVRDGMAVLLFAQVGVAQAPAAAASLAMYAIGACTGLVGGLTLLGRNTFALSNSRDQELQRSEGQQ